MSATEQTLTCNYATCEREATGVMAMSSSFAPGMFIAPYCTEHSDGVKRLGAVPAAGPALSPEAAEIEGIRGEEHHAS